MTREKFEEFKRKRREEAAARGIVLAEVPDALDAEEMALLEKDRLAWERERRSRVKPDSLTDSR